MPNLKMSKRELVLLGILFVFLVLAGYYFLVYTPQIEKLNEKQIIIEEKQLQLDSIHARISQQKLFENQIQTYNETINALTPKFYGELSQESFMLIVNELLNKAELDVSSVTFSDASYPMSEYISNVSGAGENMSQIQDQILSQIEVDDTFMNETIYTKDASINFVGDYEKLRNFLYSIDTYEKHLDISSINLSSTDGEQVIGQMVISASNLPTLDQDITDFYAGKYFTTASTREIYDNIFAHYPYYVEMQNKVLAENTSINFEDSDSITLPDSITASPFEDSSIFDENAQLADEISSDEVAYTSDGKPISTERVSVIGGFGNTGYNVIPNNPAIIGEVAKSADALEGATSIKFSYTFDDFTLTNQASIVFGEQSIMNNAFTERLRLGVKYLTDNNNKLKITLIGADGKTYDLAFDDVVSDNLWHYTYVSVPREVKYPFMVKRIYAESVDVKQTMHVELLLDELSIVDVQPNKMKGGDANETEE